VAVPFTLLAGFLGSGKTTLLNRILKEDHGERIAVMVNDFGDVNIDASLIVEASATRVTLENGCICCTIRDDLMSSVQELLKQPEPPDRVVVEMSGIAEPGAVLRTFALMERSWPLHLDGVVAVVDAEHFPPEGDPHHILAREQIALADLVILNKIDLVCEAERGELMDALHRWVPHARIVEAVHGNVPLEVVLGIGRALGDVPDSEPHQAGHGFSTLTFRERAPLSLEKLRKVFTELPPSVYRAKGFLYLADKPEARGVLQVVGRRARLSLGAPWANETPQSVIVLIGDSAGMDRQELSRLLASTVAGREHAVLAPLHGAIEWLRSRFPRPRR
jgi:G3E family GTPase